MGGGEEEKRKTKYPTSLYKHEIVSVSMLEIGEGGGGYFTKFGVGGFGMQ